MKKKTSLGDSFRQVSTPQNLVNSLHSDSCPNNELAITESGNNKESTADNNTPSTHADIQTVLTTNNNLYSLTKQSDRAFMNIQARFSATKGYID